MRNKYFIDDDEIIGLKFGRLTPIKRVDTLPDGHRSWLCLCDCGNTKIIPGTYLVNKRVTTCGCRMGIRTHGLSYHPLYSVHNDMIERCYNKNCANYKYYGAKGIGICDEWRYDFKAFYDWSIENGWEPGLSIDRYPNKTGNYEPSNCRWATRNLQDNNRTDNRVLECRGITATLADFSRMSGIAYKTISSRIDRGWKIEDAIFLPLKFSWHSAQKKSS